MTTLLLAALGISFVYAVYIATASASAAPKSADFLNGGLNIPAWAYIFGAAGIVVAALGLEDHLLLLASYGLQYNHAVLGLILAALAETGTLIEHATGGVLPAVLVIWGSTFCLGLYAIIGGWRGMVYVIAAQSLVVLVLLIVTAVTVGLTQPGTPFAWHGISVPGSIASDRLPGVIQFTTGFGKTIPAAGLWTTTQIVSFAIALTGIPLSLGFALHGVSTMGRTGLALSQVWMVSGIATGLLLFVGPLLAAEISTGAHPTISTLAAFAKWLALKDELLAVGFLLALVISQQIAVAFCVTSGASIRTTDVVVRYLRPDLTGSGQRTAARIAIGCIALAVASLASIAPLPMALLSTLTLSLSAQLLPAYFGLCWPPWISRSGVVTGLIFGLVFVVMTEPVGLIPLERLFLDLPWGRWPLTIHSAAWGLFFNLGFCIIVSLWTCHEPEREYRDRLHDEFARSSGNALGGRATRAAKWSLTLNWAFCALGPGAILGNTLFSRQTFGLPGQAAVPSLFVWQIASWFVGILLVWWLAYQSRLGVIDAVPSRTIQLGTVRGPLTSPAQPAWITRSLSRLTRRSGTDSRPLPQGRSVRLR